MKKIKVRKATWQDLGDITEFMELLSYKVSPEEFSVKLKSLLFLPNYQTLMAVANDKPVGFIALEKSFSFDIFEDYARIIALVVKEDYQNKGIGSLLLKEAEKWALSHNAGVLMLNMNKKRESAQKYFQNQGYSMENLVFQKRLVEELQTA